MLRQEWDNHNRHTCSKWEPGEEDAEQSLVHENSKSGIPLVKAFFCNFPLLLRRAHHYSPRLLDLLSQHLVPAPDVFPFK